MPGHCHCLAHHSFSHPPPLHLSFLRCLQITCLCKECLCLHKDRPTGASPARLPPPRPGLLSSLAFRHGHRTLLGAAPPTSLLADLHSQATLRLDRKCRGSCYAVARLLPLLSWLSSPAASGALWLRRPWPSSGLRSVLSCWEAWQGGGHCMRLAVLAGKRLGPDWLCGRLGAQFGGQPSDPHLWGAVPASCKISRRWGCAPLSTFGRQ